MQAKRTAPSRYQNFPCPIDSLGLGCRPLQRKRQRLRHDPARPQRRQRRRDRKRRNGRRGKASEPRVGMTADEVRAIWGEPEETYYGRAAASGRVEIWHYADGRSVQFDNKQPRLGRATRSAVVGSFVRCTCRRQASVNQKEEKDVRITSKARKSAARGVSAAVDRWRWPPAARARPQPERRTEEHEPRLGHTDLQGRPCVPAERHPVSGRDAGSCSSACTAARRSRPPRATCATTPCRIR